VLWPIRGIGDFDNACPWGAAFVLGDCLGSALESGFIHCMAHPRSVCQLEKKQIPLSRHQNEAAGHRLAAGLEVSLGLDHEEIQVSPKKEGKMAPDMSL
jgi:hypothetical protein